MAKWIDDVSNLSALLMRLSCRTGGGREMTHESAFKRWRGLTIAVRRKRRCIYLVGNGASASMASHMAADLAKNARLHTEVFSDLSLITAISNDMGYEHVFSAPLSRRACAGDMLVAISSSGCSPNVLRAVEVARQRGLSIVTLSAMRADNALRGRGILNFYIPAQTYGYAETGHAAILHHWMDLVQETCDRSAK